MIWACLEGILAQAAPAAQDSAGASPWAPAEGPLQTPWAAQVSPTNALPEYPRPQMVRADWSNLNGLWEFAVARKDAGQPQEFHRRILVPFPPESALSGIMKTVTESDQLWYRRTFQVPRSWQGRRVLLHFGAVDFEATVWVNGKQAGQHRGGYDSFSLDITELLAEGGTNEIMVSAWDPTDAGPYARGKQVRRPGGGIHYTATSGIWQSVWLEPVPADSITGLKLKSDIDAGVLRVKVQTTTATNLTVQVVALGEQKEVGRATGRVGEELAITLPNARLWSPEDPFLYDLKVQLLQDGTVVDTVASYFGLRKVALGKDDKGFTRIFLNNQPYFMLGLLDQGFWPDGLYTAPTDQALRYDIEITRRLGFNFCRKHVKVEPDRWYYWADRLGLLVWQDMPSGDGTMQGNAEVRRTAESARQFEAELGAMVSGRYNHPSIVLWTVFNEGWGEYDVPRLVQLVKRADSTRLVVGASGWFDRPVGDVRAFHQYPGPGLPKPEAERAAVVGEFGGIALTIPEHTWAGKTWGHREVRTASALAGRYATMLGAVHLLRQNEGLSGAIYTQLTDVELEGNGLLTYDRAVLKLDAAAIESANRGLPPDRPALPAAVPAASPGGEPQTR
jgi:hypothetical protein